METLGETKWDVLIAGTGLAQSLLALALSRSGKKVLHIDRHNIYGGSEAALSLQDAETWKEDVNSASQVTFENASITRPEATDPETSRLGNSRSYSLSLSPQLIYTQSKLISTLVSSQLHQTLEFQAVGNWWIAQSNDEEQKVNQGADLGIDLKRIPSGREDVFADDAIDVRSKRALMKFLRYIMDYNELETTSDAQSFGQVLEDEFHLTQTLHQPLSALSLSPKAADQTPCDFALTRIQRHMKSMGVFGSGFGSLVIKWGGLSEVAQASCRALAVGGGVYVLGSHIQTLDFADEGDEPTADASSLLATLSNGEAVEAKWVVGAASDLPQGSLKATSASPSKSARAIYIVSSPLEHLFSTSVESGPAPAGAVAVFPGAGASVNPRDPAYLLIHSSDTGECPVGQCVVYASSMITTIDERRSETIAHRQLDSCVDQLLRSTPTSISTSASPAVLWAMHYTMNGTSPFDLSTPTIVPDPLVAAMPVTQSVSPELHPSRGSRDVLLVPPPSLDLAFNDSLIDGVKQVWMKVMGDEAEDEESFMRFESREEVYDQ